MDTKSNYSIWSLQLSQAGVADGKVAWVLIDGQEAPIWHTI